MDAENELARAKWVLMGGVVFVVSSIFSYRELDYALRGNKTQATVAKRYKIRTGRYGTSEALRIEFNFVEPDGTKRQGYDTVGTDWQAPADGLIRIQYTAGENGRSRLAGRANWLPIIILLASLGLLGFFGFRLWREAAEATRPRPRKRRRRERLD
jgi:hypothetical protein